METLEDNHDDIESLLHSDEYASLANLLIKKGGKTLSTALYPPEIEYCAKILTASKFKFDDVETLITSKPENFLIFSEQYMKYESSMTMDQEYNPAEMPDFNEDANEKYVAHSKTFLFQDAVFYLMLSQQPNEVKAFLKKIRTPHYIQFAKKLLDLYSTLI